MVLALWKRLLVRDPSLMTEETPLFLTEWMNRPPLDHLAGITFKQGTDVFMGPITLLRRQYHTAIKPVAENGCK